MPVKASIFSINSSAAPCTSAFFNIGSGSSFSLRAPCSLSPDGGSSAPATSVAFSSIGSSSCALTAGSSFSSTGKGILSSPVGSASFDTKLLAGSGLTSSGGAGSSGPGISSSFVAAETTSLFSPSTELSSSSVFGFTSGSTTTTTFTGFSFGPSFTASGSSFSLSTGPVFSVTLAGSASASSPARPVFGIPTSAVGFSSGSPRNDQMNVEDSMADDTNQTAVPMVSTFGQPANSSAPPNVRRELFSGHCGW